MIDMQLLNGVLLAVAVLVAAAAALSAVALVATFVTKPGQAPHGGTRRDPQPQPQPDPAQPQPDPDHARELVLR
jgi:hypothetical protein